MNVDVPHMCILCEVCVCLCVCICLCTTQAKIEAAKSRGLKDTERAEVLQLNDLLDHVFMYDPDRRWTAEQVLKHDFFKATS
jgi:hypothetical protein